MLFFRPKSKIDLSVLKALLDNQAEALLRLDYLTLLGLSADEFKSKLDLLWQKNEDQLKDAYFSKGNEFPLLLVVKAGSIEEKIKTIGRTELDLGAIKNRESMPETDFYLLTDVEDGRGEVAKSPAESLKRFAKSGRHALTLDESIALITQRPEILKNHYLTVDGTFFVKDNAEQPLLWLLDDENRPELHYAWFDIAHGHYGSASCGRRI